LQVSLDQTIDRESLEEASVVVPSVARADCAHLQRDLFGIVVSNLPLEEARAFQAELKRRGFPTDVVADEELPVLHEPFTIQRIETGGGSPGVHGHDGAATNTDFGRFGFRGGRFSNSE
jgi:hypothetical protein